ncbi:hypothetical protein OLMES_3677 [Oleiphilus messinensis]|uniref:Uncharacterized protein n=1 Tax=Oleiphilus messinensis TaxID=141451 RepID=A0A1Y0IC15_9GAMM|nr:hypothetical protein [Oleiphilus messinensis]ARU57699.1 hypothetical protein OLMES_3677 [Oleiphilus messinensis]
MDEAKSLLRKREDYKFIMMDCYSNIRAISPLLFLDVYQYTTEYLGRHSPAMFSNSINEIDGISLLDFNQVIAVSSEFCAPIFRPTKFIRVNSEAEDECLPGIGTI